MAKILVNNSGPLHGEVWISGAKNSVLPLLAATILTDDSCVIEGVPDLADVTVMKQMLENYGACVDDSEESVIKIKTPEVVSCDNPRDAHLHNRAGKDHSARQSRAINRAFPSDAASELWSRDNPP